MKLYRAVGVDNKLRFALLEEIGLTNSKFILINLKNRKKHYFSALPFISSNGKYIISVSQPDGDDYEGLELYALEGDDYKLSFKDNKPSYYYLQGSAKWCKNTFYIKKFDSVNSRGEFYQIDF